MRGATQDECRRVAVRGDTLRVACRNMQTIYPGDTEIIYALSDDENRALIFATPGTLLKITNTRRAVWPTQIRTIFGNQAEGTELRAWIYPARRHDQSMSEPPLACLCFFRTDPWTVIQLSDLGGVHVEVIADGPPSLDLSTAEVQHRAGGPL